MANPQDEFDRQQQAVATPPAQTSQVKSLAASTDPNNARRFAKVPPGIGGNPLAQQPAQAPSATVNPIAQTAMASPARDTASAPAVSTTSRVPAPPPPLSPQAQSDRTKIGAAWEFVKDMNDSAGRAIADVAMLAPRGVAGAYDSAVVRPMRAAGINASYLSPSLVPDGVDPASMTPFMDQKRMQQQAAPGVSTTPLAPGQKPLPAGSAESQSGGGRGSINPPAADPNKPAPSMADVATAAVNPLANWDRTGMTNAQVAAANPAGRVTMTRQPNGTMAFSGGDVSGPVSYMDGSGNPLAGGGVRGNGFSRVDSASAGANVAMGPNGSFAYASGNPIANTSSGQAVPTAGQPNRVNASGSASGAVDAAVAAAAQRGDWDAVGAHFGGRGQDFGGQSAAQIRQAQSAPQGATIGGSAFGFDPQARNAQFDRDQLTRTIMDPNTKRSMRSALVSMDQTSSQSQNNAQRLASEERRSAASNDAGLEQVVMRERGEDFRAANRNQLAAAELNQRYRDSDAQNQIRNLEAARAQRSAGILERYDAARSDGERMALIRQHPDVFGQKSVQGKDRYMTVGGGTSVVDGQTVREPTMVFDTVTQQYVGGGAPGGGQAAQQTKAPEYEKGRIYVDPQSGAQRMWNGKSWDRV